ncbi:hypothetical protein CARUB_v10003358mg [Capsella rubella]|uniref:Neprosin PEP catalytic domain-containing protein n=1 Tax=Capsella rubella TaxID=81985 RepID=R0FL19_9BRAS|nr:hypothetical protein CARUB_v10003358mg [Capsella rubella]
MFLTFAILYVFFNGVYGSYSQEIDIMLKTLNKPTLKTIKSEDGDIIDCVDIYKQPAFDHPLLKDHKIQMKPSVEFVSKRTNNIASNSSSKPVTSQIWTKSGRCPVNPRLFGDTRTRLFAYWTTDGYGKTGCFNLLCSGFVQISTHVALGAAINPISKKSGKQYYITISFFLDTNTGNWWILVEDIVLGYWPGSLLKDLRHSATAVQWGGEVYSPKVRNKPHTKTSMGSGEWASNLYGKACYFTNIKIMDYSLQLKYPQMLSEFSDEFRCYSTFLYREKDKLEPNFYFGGPGQNSQCP